jgi:hypothetical protein
LAWNKGVKIRIQPFSSTDLTMQQMDDYRPGKPGSPTVQQILDYHGLFLLNLDRSYDHQALEALKRSHAAKLAQHTAAVKNIRDQRAAAGVPPNEEALQEIFETMGQATLKRKIDKLAEAIKTFEAAIGDQPELTSRQQLDPKRTVFVMDPPQEFPSVAAMEFFLSMEENAEIRARHLAFKAQAEEAEVDPSNVDVSELLKGMGE